MLYRPPSLWPHPRALLSVTRTEVDLIFTKAKPKGERRLEFRCFLDALSALSEKRYPDREPADGLRHLLTDHLAPLWSFVQVRGPSGGPNVAFCACK